MDDGIMALDEGYPVNRRGALQATEGSRCRCGSQEPPSRGHPMFRTLLTTPVCCAIFFCSIMIA